MPIGKWVIASLGLLVAQPGVAADRITFGTNWLAEAEHGGFYQALADGTYAKYGLEVKLLAGGPQANNRLLQDPSTIVDAALTKQVMARQNDLLARQKELSRRRRGPR